MILTVTLNPSLDRTVELPAPLRRGAVQRADGARQDAGGKGVNISRALRASGVPTLAVLPGDPGDPLLAELTAAEVPYEAVPVGAPIRSNITITEPDGTTTKINAPGAPLGTEHVDAVVELLVDRGADASWVVLAGSLPPGAPEDVYARIVRRVRTALGERSPLFAVDTSGAALQGAVSGDDALPDLIKPNGEELAELVGTVDGERLEADPDLAAATAAALVDRGRETLEPLGDALRHVREARADPGHAARRRLLRPERLDLLLGHGRRDERRPDRAGGDRVDPDPLLGQLAREAAGEVVDAGLGGGVVEQLR